MTTTPWTQAQRTAIDHVAGDLLVSAAAGSGKTAVLAERCARLVTHDDPKLRTSVDRLLVMTFTDAAANEMRTRIADAIRQKVSADPATRRTSQNLIQQLALVERASIGTIDGFCARILRTYFHDAAVDPAFEIIDSTEAELLKEETLDAVIAAWHAKPPEDPAAQAFADFWEAYGQGKDSLIKEHIFNLDKMLSVVAEPDDYLAAARHAYTKTGAQKVIAQLAQKLTHEITLFIAQLARSVAELSLIPGLQDMTARLSAIRHTALAAKSALEQPTPDWQTCGQLLRDFKSETLRTNKDVPDFALLKERHFAAAKDQLSALAAHFPPPLTEARMLADMLSLAAPFETLIALTTDFRTAYWTAKQQQNRLDFSDIKRLAYTLLKHPSSPAALDLKKRYDHVMVDEAQDINPLDAAIINCVRSDLKFNSRGNLFIVGDVKQSIYGFRLAEPRIFVDREQLLSTLTTHEAVIYLQNNFRSLPPLLNSLNAIFLRLLTPPVAGVPYANGHTLIPPAAPPTQPDPACFTGSPVELLVGITDAEEKSDTEEENESENENAAIPLTAVEREAELVADRVARLLSEGKKIRTRTGATRSLAPRDIAILLRSARVVAPAFTRALAARNIPVHADLSVGYFDAQEIRDTLALLSIIDNPLQDIPLATALLSPFGRFTHNDLATIRLAFDRKTTPFADAVRLYADKKDTNEETLAPRLRTFLTTLETYRRLMRTLPLHEALAEIYRTSGLLTYVAGLPAGAQRVANLHMLHHRALEFGSFRRQGLYRFLKFIERLRNREDDFGAAPVLSEAADVVRIMTVHKSKGLEFPVVIVAGLGRKFNEDRGAAIMVDPKLHVGLLVANVEGNVYYPSALSRLIELDRKRHTRAEELRLLYVALTRAREHLILTAACKQKTLDRYTAEKFPGPFPEDALLSANTLLEWCATAAANEPAHITLTPITTLAPATTAIPTAPDPLLQQLITGTPLQNPPTANLAPLIARLQGAYTHQPLITLPALVTVTELKRRAAVREEPESPAQQQFADPLTLTQPLWLQQVTPTAADRGTATHHFLELLDFSTLTTPRDLQHQLDFLVSRSKLTPIESALITLPDLAWFLFDTPLGQKLRAASIPAQSPLFNPTPPITLHRELSFSLMIPPGELLGMQLPASEPLDQPQVRGVIDLLLISDTTVEIIDYKTDDARVLTQDRIAGYEKQMQLYSRAAENILQRKVNLATLIFLSAHQLHPIPNPAQ